MKHETAFPPSDADGKISRTSWKEWILKQDSFCLFVLAFLLSLLLAICTPMPESDIARYGSIVASFTEGDWRMVFHPRISPLMPLLAGVVATGTGAEPFFALQLVSTLFFALTIFPLYGIFRTCFSPLTVRIALLMAAFASIPLRYGASGLRDSGKGFFYILCVYLLVEVYRKRTELKNYVFLGIAASLLALTRTEAPVYAGMFGLSVLGLELWRKKIVFPWRSCLCGLTALLLLSPWLAFMYRTTGYPVPEIRYVPLIQKMLKTVEKPVSTLPPPARAVSTEKRVQQEKQDQGRGESSRPAVPEPEKKSQPLPSEKSVAGKSTLYQRTAQHQNLNKVKEYEGFYKEFLSGVIGGFFPPLGIFALLGILLRIRSRKWTAEESLVLAALLLHALLLIVQIRVAGEHFYMSRRYLITVVALEFGWSAYGVLRLYKFLASRLDFLRRRWLIVLLFLIPCVSLYLYAFQRTIKTYTSRKKSAERIALFSISDYIRKDYRGPDKFFRENSSLLEYQTNRLPAVLCGFPQLGFLAGGQTVSFTDPLFANGVLKPDYIIARPGEFPSGSLEAFGYRFRQSFSAGEERLELFSRK